MDETEVKKSSFWDYYKDNPLLLYPMLIVVGIAITNIFFVKDPLLSSLLQMGTWTAIGAQWIGIARSHEKRKIERLKLDRDLLKTYTEFSALTGEPMIRFLVPRQEKFISRTWNKLRRKTTLSLYERVNSDFPSFTKLYVTKKDMFDMQLRGYINTEDGELALKGIQYLTRGKKLEDIL